MSAMWLVLLAAWATLAHAAEKGVFSHRLHVEREELKCRDCHARAWTSDQAADDLSPRESACADCHEPGKVKTAFPPAAREIRFSHRKHLEDLKLPCEQCHAAVAGMDRPGLGALPEMATCMTCHNAEAAPRECESCHTLERAQLRPASHQPGWKETHRQQARLSDSSCLPCHRAGDCQECHEGALLSELDSGARQTPFTPEMQGGKGQVLQRVHGLNYRFLHGLEARGKNSQCVTCHELDAGDFCAQCHNPAVNPQLRPVWHGGPDWGALAGGVGTGGGRHAQLARQDMENCISCHDLEGGDSTCLLCHMDRTPGKGNDPRTHGPPDDFKDEVGEGDFHEDDGATCFTCHTFKGPAGGNGFCGYCHGPKDEEEEEE